MNITKKEAIEIVRVLNEGMPVNESKRMFLAELSNKLEEFVEKGFEETQVKN